MPSTCTGGRRSERARSAVVRMKAPPASVTRQQSRWRSGSAIRREAITSSIDVSSRR